MVGSVTPKPRQISTAPFAIAKSSTISTSNFLSSALMVFPFPSSFLSKVWRFSSNSRVMSTQIWLGFSTPTFNVKRIFSLRVSKGKHCLNPKNLDLYCWFSDSGHSGTSRVSWGKPPGHLPSLFEGSHYQTRLQHLSR